MNGIGLEWLKFVLEALVLAGTAVGIYISVRMEIRGVASDVKLTRHDVQNLKQRQEVLSQLTDTIRSRVEDEIDEAQHNVGEVGASLRQKIQEVELWSRDNFIRKETFNMILTRIDSDIRSMNSELKSVGDKMEVRLVRVEEKIDSAKMK